MVKSATELLEIIKKDNPDFKDDQTIKLRMAGLEIYGTEKYLGIFKTEISVFLTDPTKKLSSWQLLAITRDLALLAQQLDKLKGMKEFKKSDLFKNIQQCKGVLDLCPSLYTSKTVTPQSVKMFDKLVKMSSITDLFASLCDFIKGNNSSPNHRLK